MWYMDKLFNELSYLYILIWSYVVKKHLFPLSIHCALVSSGWSVLFLLIAWVNFLAF
uniref:Uncharacterized protein n=1 Tax=Rhizophora mucronata TaxID=61149 RepID=A0A2P2Q6K8_RHIMU